MRFTTILVSGAFAVMAAAQGTGTSPDPAQQAITACIKACDVKDVDCKSHCIAVPSPNRDQAIKTTQCIAKCPQGDGTQAETAKYIACSDACINGNFFQASEGTPAPTGSSSSDSSSAVESVVVSSSQATGTASGSTAAPTDAQQTSSAAASQTMSPTSSGSPSGTASGTQSGASVKPTDSGAQAIVGSSAAILGVVAAMFAL